jgi:hypothetical protein
MPSFSLPMETISDSARWVTIISRPVIRPPNYLLVSNNRNGAPGSGTLYSKSGSLRVASGWGHSVGHGWRNFAPGRDPD